MNPLTNVKNIQKMNERMLEMGVEDSEAWHKQYKDSAYVFIGGLPYDLTEGDILCVFSQYGEIVNINLVRDKKTGNSKGFCFLCYEDQRSTILAVDNFNGIKLGGRIIRVDHCSNYRRPKSDEKDEQGNRKEIIEEGCAPKTPSPSPPASDDEEILDLPKKRKKEKKVKKQKKHKEEKSQKKKKMTTSSGEEDLEEPNRKKTLGSARGTEDYKKERADQGLPRDSDSRNLKVSSMRDSASDRDFGERHANRKEYDSKGEYGRDVRVRDRNREREINERDRETRNRDIHERDRETRIRDFREREVDGTRDREYRDSRDRHATNYRIEQRDKDYHSSRDNRGRQVDERGRDRFDKRRDHRENEGRAYERRDRDNFGDRRDKR